MSIFSGRRRARGIGLGVAVVLVASTLTSCDPLFDVVITSPTMSPVFQTGVTDYVNRCNPNGTTRVDVKGPPGARISIAGQRALGGRFTANVRQRYNERFTIVVTLDGTTTVHNVRCLPPGFPEWEVHGNGETPQSEFYLTTLIRGFAPNRPVIFDSHGVPVWWGEETQAFLTTLLPNGNLATLPTSGGMIEERFDGSAVRVLDTEGAPSDFHDVLLLENGNYVMVTADVRACDLAAWGQAPSRCLFHEVQELTPEGEVVWRWRPEEDIPIGDTPPRWRSVFDPVTNSVDPWHWNSIEWVGDGFIMSFRHQDAVFKIDYATKDIVWKLGGKTRAESLRVIGDPVFDKGSTISGQHDARLLPDGTVMLYDNRTSSSLDQRPRTVRYRIDEAAGTATLVSQLRDAVAPTSACCGSARRLATGNIVTGWGGTPWFTENEPDGTQVLRLKGIFVYRVIPLLPGVLDRDAIRDGMDDYWDGAALSEVAQSGPSLPARDATALGDPRIRLGVEP